MTTSGQTYVELIGGQNLNIQDLLNNNKDVTLNRVNVVCDTSNGLAIGIQLPDIANLNGFSNFEVTVDDKAGNAAVGNITITRGGTTNKINNGTSVVINSNFGKMFFVVASLGTTGGWQAFSSAALTPYTPPIQQNFQTVVSGANTATTPFPILASCHLIVVLGGAVRTITTNYTVVYATGVITFGGGTAPGDPVNIFYSHN